MSSSSSYQYCIIRSVERPATAWQAVWSWWELQPPVIDRWLSFLSETGEPPVNLTDMELKSTGPYYHFERIPSLTFPYLIKLDRHILFQDSNLDANHLFSEEFLAAHPTWTKHELYSNLLFVYHKADVGVSSAKSEKAFFLTEICEGNEMHMVVGYLPKLFSRELVCRILKDIFSPS